jgi:hypothetical protein
LKNLYRLMAFYKIYFIAFFIIISAHTSFAQIGGDATFDFLDLSPSPRITALGGLQVAYQDEDNSSAFDNPALLNPQMNDRVSLNTVSYLAGINYGNASYAHTFDSIGTFHAGIQYVNYGDFDATDVTGASLGTFRAAEYALYVGGARTYLTKFSYGVNVKLLYSDLESYTSSGIAADIGGAYTDTAHLFNAGVVFRNMGIQFKTYTGTHEPLPFEIDLGVSKALAHFPLRIFVTVQHLETFNIRYNDTTQQSESNIFGDTASTKSKSTVFDNIFRHFIIGGELTLGKHILIEGSYNDLRRQELAIAGKMGLAGYSIGVGIKINRFSISYSHAVYDVAGGADNFSLNIAVGGLFKKKQIQPAS